MVTLNMTPETTEVLNLKYFLISAPVDWPHPSPIRRFPLPTGDSVTCVYWDNLYHISGTDIVRCLAFRFHAFGRPVKNAKKFEEGVFSDLRNLKAGTDATLEEPKSAFLDFLYKNNCIRTQKKQKVFYWYSVPHDRLFLDALERDLKREKQGQEVTTAAEREPALSFEYDGTTSLFEQMTKNQQAQASSYQPLPQTYLHSASPVVRAVSSMPPPQTVLYAAQQAPEEAVNDHVSYSPIPARLPPPAAPTTTMMMMKKEPYANLYSQQPFNRPAFPHSHTAIRHNSMPVYMEYSPAPSFNSSQSFREDYSARTMSFEPITPPQQPLTYHPAAPFTPQDDSLSYGAISLTPQVYQQMVQMNQNFSTQPNFVPRSNATNAIYSRLESSPTYRIQQRRSPFGHVVPYDHTSMEGMSTDRYGAQYTSRHPSDLRRSISTSLGPLSEQYPKRHVSAQATLQNNQRDGNGTPDMSRQGTPTITVEQHHPIPVLNQRYGVLMNNTVTAQPQFCAANLGPGAVRRARSATTAAGQGPYSTKSHCCPISTCGSVFKRLEHLKRHVRTHTQERPHKCSDCDKTFSRSDNLAQHRRTHETGIENLDDEECSASEIDENGLESLRDLRPDVSAPNNQSSSYGQTTLFNQIGSMSQFATMAPPPVPVMMTTTNGHQY